jgi:hypothetical protein
VGAVGLLVQRKGERGSAVHVQFERAHACVAPNWRQDLLGPTEFLDVVSWSLVSGQPVFVIALRACACITPKALL